MTSRQHQILDALRHGELTETELAEELQEPGLFALRAELNELRRKRIVRDVYWRPRGSAWRLTSAGELLVESPEFHQSGRQLRLAEVRDDVA